MVRYSQLEAMTRTAVHWMKHWGAQWAVDYLTAALTDQDRQREQARLKAERKRLQMLRRLFRPGKAKGSRRLSWSKYS